MTGQAFVSIDRQYHPDPAENTSYTCINMGMDIEVQTNIDVLEVGRYKRAGEKSGSADLLIENFALGYINNQAFVYGEGTTIGELDPVRAEYAGIPNGEQIVIKDVDASTRALLKVIRGTSSSEITLPGCNEWYQSCTFAGRGNVEIEVQSCEALGIDVCFKLDNYNSLPIGEVTKFSDKDSRLTGMTLAFRVLRYWNSPHPRRYLSRMGLIVFQVLRYQGQAPVLAAPPI